MKKFISSLALGLFAFAAVAQQYTFSHTTGTYTPISGATSVNNGQIWNDNDYLLQIGFPFVYAGITYTSLEIDSDGEIEFAGAGNPEIKVFDTELIDKGTAISLSPISTVLNGSPGSQIRIIEWSNAGFETGAPTDFVNFQVWLYEGTNLIEIRMGPSSVANISTAFDGDPGPEVRLMYDGSSSGGTDFGLMLTGPANDPVAQVVSNPALDYNLQGLGSDGKIYRFSSTTLATPKTLTQQALILYPNPATDELTIDLPAFIGQSGQLAVYNALGSLVLQQTSVYEGKNMLRVGNLPAGIYSVEITQDKQIVRRQFLKQ